MTAETTIHESNWRARYTRSARKPRSMMALGGVVGR